ncbi:sugar transferase [Corynebacterium aurimucosum ATCC 700975]|uniref:Sugar transferase n=1 Tax=Corynebacterium aurimucosum (strain ATCC 700975 / DSM 44827 / CIP 107346 / CN-1) TaxID=548476 RepID=C3PKS9_CORA7|nr:sugar transferase [Corynebacterium aurimucosum]ACP32015.1 sugar transferase [Corynebacterium aurimucosum ATCC 700975]QQU93780.1 sugar transferase [Corynebacterium aurimucosum]
MTTPNLRPASTLAVIPDRSSDAPALYTGAKRISDILLSATALILLSPVLLIVALLIKLDDGGPVFFAQTRVGYRQGHFTMLKFRTMRTNAEQLVDQLLAAQASAGNAGNEVLFKLQDDPRITRVGRFLRRTSLDELPQLFNVLTGRMSLIGPRPPLPREVAKFTPRELGKFNAKPGITGLWQVMGRSTLSWEDSINLDLRYCAERSFGMDIMIFFRTFKVLATQEGAY